MDITVHSQSLYTYNISCPDGWQKALNNCYLFNVKDQLNWNEARTECSLRNADLMVIGNKQERDWIAIQTESYNTDEWWIGLRYMTKWTWVQYGGNTRYITWRNEPDNYDEQDCCAINEYGLFSDEYCKSKLGFICSYPLKRGDFCPSGDNSPWFMTDSACYFISPLLNISLHLSWQDAKTYCANLSPSKSSQLMSVTTYDNMLSLKSLLSTYDTAGVLLPWWTGLNDQSVEGKYVWIDNTEANGTLLQWDVAPSLDRSQNRNCGVMYQGGSIDDVTCDKRAHYVCEMSAMQGHLNLGCGSWLRGGKSCYLLGKGKEYTWQQASQKCSSAGAHLLQIDDLDEKAWIEGLSLGPSGYWTGLARAQNKYGWAWPDQSTGNDTFIKWSQEPNNSGGIEDCVAINKQGLYVDKRCDAKTGYICEYAKAYDQPCMPGWTQCEQSCYYASPSNWSYAITWYEAEQKCMDLVAGKSLSAYRLAVNDKTEQACILKTLAAQPNGGMDGYWTDLNDLQFKGIWRYWLESNNEPNNDLITWAREPNNAGGNENCGVIYNQGYFNDADCSVGYYYICERPVAGAGVNIKVSTILLMSLSVLTAIL
ncbi:hypothetical protein ACF0H5_009251 [Mactra antiquata]